MITLIQPLEMVNSSVEITRSKQYHVPWKNQMISEDRKNNIATSNYWIIVTLTATLF